jgi:hypothetical protein
MTRSTTLFATASIVALTVAFAPPARAQDVLPRPEQTFKGHIGRTVEESTKDFPQEVKAPKGAPNILLILTDDVGRRKQYFWRTSSDSDHGSTR